jgi:hypothetical protein
VATFLTTPKMSPELALRLERGLSKRRVKSKFNTELQSRPRGSSTARALVVLAFLLVAAAVYAFDASEKRELETRRGQVMSELGRRRAALPDGYAALLPKVERWAAEATRDVQEDQIAPELKSKAGLDAWLSRRAIYVRGPAGELGRAATLSEAAAASDKDAFLYCLMRPPPSRTEEDVLARGRGVNFGGAVVGDATRNVRRLHDALVGLDTVGKAFEAKVAAADSQSVVQALARQLDRTSLDATREALQAELLVVVAEDGPLARAVMVDLTADRLLAHIQRRRDVARASPSQKLHAAELSACELALEVRGQN